MLEGELPVPEPEVSPPLPVLEPVPVVLVSFVAQPPSARAKITDAAATDRVSCLVIIRVL